MKKASFVVFAAVALLLGTGPTVGDVGGCGASPSYLSESRFASARKTLDCQRCQECGITTHRCQDACDPNIPSDTGFPQSCKPLLHDGEVCLNALAAASCSDYAAYVDDTYRAVPTECQFCRGDAAEAPLPSLADGGP